MHPLAFPKALFGRCFINGALNGLMLNYAGVDERMLSWR